MHIDSIPVFCLGEALAPRCVLHPFDMLVFRPSCDVGNLVEVQKLVAKVEGQIGARRLLVSIPGRTGNHHWIGMV